MSSKSSRYSGHGSVHGVVVLDKPAGPTSHDVVAAARRHFKTRRVGHAGTLDPLATGVLVLLFGEATKLSAYLTRDVKSYRADVRFGSTTTTLDAAGVVTRRQELTPGWLSREALESALENEKRRTLQVPPRVSAIKVAGKPAHARVRQGEDLELDPRDVKLHAWQLVSWSDQGATIELTVSKGYYVRAFARDLGDTLGVPAHLGALRRTRSGPFTLEQAVPFPFSGPLVPASLAEVAKRAFPSVELTEQGTLRAGMGKLLVTAEDCEPAVDEAPAEQPGAVACLRDGKLIALAEPGNVPGTLRILRGFHDPGSSDLHAP